MSDVVQHYVYLGETTIEEVIEVDYERRRLNTTHNILPAAPPLQPVIEVQPRPLPEPEPQAEPESLPVEEAPSEPSDSLVLGAVGPQKEAAPAVIRGVKTTLASFAGMLAAGLAYVAAHLESIGGILSWKILVPIITGAVIAGLLYGLDKYYRPGAKF